MSWLQVFAKLTRGELCGANDPLLDLNTIGQLFVVISLYFIINVSKVHFYAEFSM